MCFCTRGFTGSFCEASTASSTIESSTTAYTTTESSTTATTTTESSTTASSTTESSTTASSTTESSTTASSTTKSLTTATSTTESSTSSLECVPPLNCVIDFSDDKKDAIVSPLSPYYDCKTLCKPFSTNFFGIFYNWWMTR